MKILFTTVISFLIILACLGQEKTAYCSDKREINKYIVGFIPSKANNIYGIAIGPIGSEAICNKPYTKYSYGLNLQIPGQGFLQALVISNPPFKQVYARYPTENKINAEDTVLKRVIHNGLMLSIFGTFSDQVNGVSISGWMSMGNIINGVSVNLLWNLYKRINGLSIGVVNNSIDVKGVQIGLINKTANLKGFQIGLWNRNSKRSLPLINWSFAAK